MKNEYAVLVNARQIETKYDYGTFELRIVQIVDGQLGNPDNDDPFCDLVFHAQWDTNKPEDTHTYGWNIFYRDCYRVELDNAKRMLKTLQRVEKINSLETTNPVRPVTFGQFVALSASALGIKTARRESRYSAGSSSYAENTYITLDLHDLQSVIDYLIQESRETKTV